MPPLVFLHKETVPKAFKRQIYPSVFSRLTPKPETRSDMTVLFLKVLRAKMAKSKICQ